MTWTKNISDCRFMLDLAWLTIISKESQKLVGDLGKYMQKGRTVLENKTNHPIMPDIFRQRTYFNYGPLKKVYLLHEKISAAQGIDALLVIHDVSLIPLLQIEQILAKLSAVSDFHFCRIEFTWDFYPGSKITAPKLQRKIVQLFHISHSRKTWSHPSRIYNKRITYYINTRNSDIQAKTYLRPKKPGTTAIEFVRVELIAKTRWLKGIGLIKPSDFLGLKFQQIVYQVRWLKFDWHELRRRSQLHLLSGGFWFANLLNDWQYLGISYCLNIYRSQKVCPSQCKHRGNPKLCRLYEAYSRQQVSNELIPPIRACPYAIKQPRFENDYCQPSKHHKFLMQTMKQAYLRWNQPPLFPVTITALTVKPKKKRSIGKRSLSSNQIHRKGGKKQQKQKPKIKLYKLFKKRI